MFSEKKKSHLGYFDVISTTLHFFFLIFVYLFIYGCVGSSFLCKGFPQLWQAGATLHRGVRASHYRDLSCYGAQAPDAQAQQLWLMGPVAPRHVGSSQTRARTRVPCIGRQILNHCTTREAPTLHFFNEGKETNILVSILCARLCAKCFPYVSQHPMRKIVLFLFHRPVKAK